MPISGSTISTGSRRPVRRRDVVPLLRLRRRPPSARGRARSAALATTTGCVAVTSAYTPHSDAGLGRRRTKSPTAACRSRARCRPSIPAATSPPAPWRRRPRRRGTTLATRPCDRSCGSDIRSRSSIQDCLHLARSGRHSRLGRGRVANRPLGSRSRRLDVACPDRLAIGIGATGMYRDHRRRVTERGDFAPISSP